MASIKKIMIMAGGTGGHIFPGIAIAHAIQKSTPDACILWLGSKEGMETHIIPGEPGITLYALRTKGFRKKSFFQKLITPFYLLFSILQAIKILQKEKPDIVLGMGGFVSLPGGFAARLLKIPLYIHEQNSIAGLTNKILASFAQTVFTGFPRVFGFPSPEKNKKFVFVGNPVRDDILGIPPKTQLHTPIRLLILGGSRGAKILNDVLPEMVRCIPPEIHLEIFHQTGKESIAKYAQLPENIKVIVLPFIENIAMRYAWADVIICRAGALTLAEITAVGIPAVLIPYPHAVDDHQTKNAEYLSEKQAAVILPQTVFTPERLFQELMRFFEAKEYFNTAKASRTLRQGSAIQKILVSLGIAP